MTDALIGIAGVIALLVAHAWFVGGEFGLVAVDRTRIEQLAAEQERFAIGVLRSLRTLSFQLSASQLGITLTSLLVGFLVQPVLAPIFEPLLTRLGLGSRAVESMSVVVALLVATTVEMVFAELVPKNYAVSRPLRAARIFVGPLRWFATALRPLIVVLDGAANWTVRRFGVEPREELRSVRSLEELELLARISGHEGTLERAEARLLTRTLRLSHKTVADVLVPRLLVRAVDKTASVTDLFAVARVSGHSRFLVFGADLDDLLGVVHVKDGYAVPVDERETTPVERLYRPVVVVPASRELDALLHDLRGQGGQLAAVVDEFGGLDGIVTIEDVVEELVGEIEDEFDAERVPRPRPSATEDGGRIVAGSLHRHELKTLIGLMLPEGPYETVAGFVLDQLGHIPVEGDTLRLDDWRFTIVAMDARRIAWLQIVPPASPGLSRNASR